MIIEAIGHGRERIANVWKNPELVAAIKSIKFIFEQYWPDGHLKGEPDPLIRISKDDAIDLLLDGMIVYATIYKNRMYLQVG